MFKIGDRVRVIGGPSFLIGLTGSIEDYPSRYFIIPDNDEWQIACRYIKLNEEQLEFIEDDQPLPLSG